MKIKHKTGLFQDDELRADYYLDITMPLRVLTIYPQFAEYNKDITALWTFDEFTIQENIDNGTWVEFE
jgi:hypothetical protein